MASYVPGYTAVKNSVYEFFHPLFTPAMLSKIPRLCPGEPLTTPDRVTLSQIQRVCRLALTDLDNKDYMEGLSILVRAYNYDKYKQSDKIVEALSVVINNAIYECVYQSGKHHPLRMHLKNTYKIDDKGLDNLMTEIGKRQDTGYDIAKVLLTTNFHNARDLINFEIGAVNDSRYNYRL